MLFNSYIFLYVFLPVTLLVYAWLARSSRQTGIAWLLVASLGFYGWWDPNLLPLLLASIVFNYAAGVGIAASRRHKGHVLGVAVALNLGLLAWFKYANFLAGTVTGLVGADWRPLEIVLPLGISFFTFTQIAYLVDVGRGEVREHNLLQYGLFVTYFPHLIAGPVLHHKEMMPQFQRASVYRLKLDDVVIGLFVFGIGLFKKVVVADGVQPYVAPVFDAAPTVPLGFADAWAGALAYALQIYFDFSGYSDMAVGVSRMFGITLPLNFNSPYKAASIIDFWRRWHMTLSRFLRDYLYIAMGGNQRGVGRRYLNLVATMLLGGLWHGASWTFVLWGGVHGVYLVVNHLWRRLVGASGESRRGVLGHGLAVVLTFVAVVLAWVPFRAASFEAAHRVLAAMMGAHALAGPIAWADAGAMALYADGATVWVWIVVGVLVVWGAPNSQELADKLAAKIVVRDGVMVTVGRRFAFALVGGVLVMVGLLSAIAGSRGTSEFIYFNF